MQNVQLLLGALLELADSSTDEFNEVELLSLLADRCVELLEASEAGVLLSSSDGTLQLVASSRGATRLIDLLTHHADSEAPLAAQPAIGDVATSAPAPPITAAALLAASSPTVRTLPLRAEGKVIGVLNLYGESVASLGADELEMAQAMVDMATMSVLQGRAAKDAHRLIGQLTTALSSRILIEQAKGVLAGRGGLDVDSAFKLIRAVARHNHLRLIDVAQDIVQGGPLWPGLAPLAMASPDSAA